MDELNAVELNFEMFVSYVITQLCSIVDIPSMTSATKNMKYVDVIIRQNHFEKWNVHIVFSKIVLPY